MNKGKLKKQIEDTRTDYKILDKLRNELGQELQKTFKKRDFDKIEKLTQLIRELTEGKADIKKRTENGIAMLKEKISENESIPIKHRFRKAIIYLSTCLAVLLIFNFMSLSAWGMNIFSAVVRLNKDSILIDFGKQNSEIINLPVSEDDPYGMKRKCAELGLYPETPAYLPEGFDLVNLPIDEMKTLTSIRFYYKKDNMKMNICYDLFKMDKVPPIGIPVKTHNVSEIEINNHTAYIVKDETRFTATYMAGDIVHSIFADNVDYNECEKVLESFS